MLTAGIDMGARYIKVAVLRDGELIGATRVACGFDPTAAAQRALDEALDEAGAARGELARLVATGAGRKRAPSADGSVTDVHADARGAVSLFPDARTVVDVGAEEGRAIRIDAQGKVLDFAVNEKCAAGAGAFTEAMARAMEMSSEEFGRASLESDRDVAMSAQCTVFAESEVVALLHANTARADIARAVHDSIAGRIRAMVRRAGLEPEVVVVGGLARDPGFRAALRRALALDRLRVPERPSLVGAIGAALIAADEAGETR